MKKILPLILLVPCIAFGASSHTKADSKAKITQAGNNLNVKSAAPVKGTVVDATGQPLAGVSVVVKGTTNGTQTDVNGKFTLNVSQGDVLVFSYIGYIKKEVAAGDASSLTVTLAADSKSLNEVVVTALGITRNKSSLTYDQQTVSGKELEVAKDASFVNSLAGKVSGLVIDQSSSGVGGSTKVVLRGNKSINSNNNVLYVVDGIPLSQNTSAQPNGGIYNYAPEAGDGISNINPDDIESMTVLKGASASALYGSAAANGVILITTKKGKAGRTNINFSSNNSFDKPFGVPVLQTDYAQGDSDKVNTASPFSWGVKQSGGTNSQPSDFFNTGHTLINSLTLSTGSDKNQTFVSYANTHSSGIEPGNSFDRNNVSIHNNTNFFNDKLEIDENVSYIQQRSVDRPNYGTYYNPLTGVYLFPRGLDFDKYKTFEVFDPNRNINAQNWPFLNTDYQQNPYWIQYRDPVTQNLNRILAAFTAKYNIADWINFQARVKLDRTAQNNNQKLYATTTTQLGAGTLGQYIYNQSTINQVYADALLNINKKFNDFTLAATLGGSLQNNQTNGTGFNGKLSLVDNYFNVNNLDKTSIGLTQDVGSTTDIQSVFASANLGYKDMLFLEATGRNDWTSTLAFTDHPSFFYPSVGLTDVLSNTFKMPDFISYSKVRVSYAEVGNGLPSYISTNPPQYPVGSTGISLPTTAPFLDLKPERTHSFEVGTEWRFFNDRLSFDATYYHTNTYNQLFNVATTGSSKYQSRYINAGDVQNKGFEGSLSYNGPIGGQLTWSPTVTFSLNRNKIVNLFTYTDPNTGLLTDEQTFALPGAFKSYELEAVKGKPYGELFAQDFQRDAKGNIIVTDGKPQLNTTNGTAGFVDVGNSNPSVLLGFNNSFKYQHFDLSFLVDGRFGGKVLDMTDAYLDYYGVSQASAQARNNGGVNVNGTKVSPETYYQVKGGPLGALATYAYSATNVRLREASLGYTIPGLFNNTIKSVRVAVLARNLFFFYKKAPYDPDVALSTDNGTQGIDVFGQPSIRSYGFNVSVGF